jgi:hypothetical protein
MKKPFAKQIIMGTMALTLIGGGGALAISNNAFAATSATSMTSAAPQQGSKGNHSFGEFKGVSDQLLTFLKLDKATFTTKSATETLAQIATDQGITREALKAELTAEENAKLDKEKADFAANIDNTIDSVQKGENGESRGNRGSKIDLTSTAAALGYATVAELKTALVSGTSIADLATAKGVKLQSIIDLEVVQIVKDLDAKLAAGTITQAQYDKQKASSTSIATKIVNDKHNSNNKHNKNNNHQNKNNNQNDTEVNDDAAAAPTTSTAPTTN